MGRIKTRESVKDIKILDKAAVVSERMKTALVRSKDQAENLMDDGQISPSEYAEDKIRYAAEDVTDQVWHEVSGQTKKAIEKGKEAHREHRNEKRIHKNEERVRRYEEELRRGAPSRTPREEAARQAARQNTEATRTSIRSRRNQTIKSAERTERTILAQSNILVPDIHGILHGVISDFSCLFHSVSFCKWGGIFLRMPPLGVFTFCSSGEERSALR